jgi:hypothetical protein
LIEHLTEGKDMELWRRLALDPAAHRLVTLVGGGGKTTLLYAWRGRRG